MYAPSKQSPNMTVPMPNAYSSFYALHPGPMSAPVSSNMGFFEPISFTDPMRLSMHPNGIFTDGPGSIMVDPRSLNESSQTQFIHATMESVKKSLEQDESAPKKRRTRTSNNQVRKKYLN